MKNTLIATITLLFLTWAIYLIVKKNNLYVFDLISISLNLNLSRNEVDSNIVIVNIGNLNREGIAKQIAVINNHHPKVIGIDAFFKDYHPEDSALEQSFKSVKNLVLSSHIKNYDPENDYYLFVDLPFYINDHLGFVTTTFEHKKNGLPYQEYYLSKANTYGFGEVFSFPVEVVKRYDSTSFSYFINNRCQSELINFRGDINKFIYVNEDQIFDPSYDLSFLKNKIVIMGYVGKLDGDLQKEEDVSESPIGSLYGVVILANQISMILNKTYIDEMSKWTEFFLAIVFAIGNIFIFKFFYSKSYVIYSKATKAIQLAEIILLCIIAFVALHYFQYKIQITFLLILLLISGDLYFVCERLASRFKLK